MGFSSAGGGLTTDQTDFLSHWTYDPTTRRLVSDKAIETTLNSLYLGEQHKMSSGSDNIYFTNLSSDTNYFPMWGGLKDQAITANRGSTGFIPPSGRVYTDMFSLPLGGQPDPLTSVGYAGDNYFGVNISGLGITTTAAEAVGPEVRLEYRITINGRQVYMQVLPRNATRSTAGSNIYAGDVIEWFFDHPVDVRAGTTLFAEIHKVRNSDDVDLGVFQVRQGDTVDPNTGLLRYQATVHNRLFTDKDIELISPYLKYKAMDFSVDSTGTSILLKDLSLATGEELLIPHPINTLQAIAVGTNIQIKVKGGAKVIIESLPVNAVSVNGNFVNAILNSAVAELNNLFTNTLSFANQGNPVLNVLLSEQYLTVILSDLTSFSVDITTLGVDTNNFVVSGVANGTDITLTMGDATTVVIDATGLGIGGGVTVDSGAIVGSDIVLTMSDTTTVTIDATSLNTGTSTQVASGAVVGSDLVLTMADGSQITIDASNMINGSTLTATNDSWFISYGANANEPVAANAIDTTIVGGTAVSLQGPYYFGQKLERGQEFKWNLNNGNTLRLGIWDGAEVATSFQNQANAANWNTVFSFANGSGKFTSSTNTDVTTYHASGYSATNNAPMSIRFGNDGHLTLMDLSGGTETVVAKTTIPLAVTEFNLQFGGFSNSVFPNGIIDSADFIWEIVHDYASTEAGIINGILDHTVLKSAISILPGEKLTFMLDEVAQGDLFGTDYTAAATGVLTAEEQLSNTFIYQTNEAVVIDTAIGVSDWNANTSASNYFYAASLHQYRNGAAGTIQGLFSLRYLADNSLEIYSEDHNEVVATAKAGGDGSAVHLYFGVKGNRAYYSIPVLSKQTIGQGSQPILTFAPDVSNQSFAVTEGEAFNIQIALDANSDIVNMYGEVDAPTWAILGQVNGQFIGTAPAFLGTAGDAYVINCKAANAIGGITNFTVTINVTEVAYTNSKSLQFTSNNATHLTGNPSNVTALQRAANGSGATDAWTISLWVYPSASSNQETILYYGGTDVANDGCISITQFSGGNISFQYGKNAQKLAWFGIGNFTLNQWNHVMVTYDGGTTGVDPADVSNYLARFSMFINGVNGISQLQQINAGYDGAILPQEFKIGRYTTGSPNNFGGKINQVAIWDTDESANIATIYNSGTAHDLTLLTPAPANYYEIETSVTTIADIEGSAPLTGYNFSSGDLVTDTP